MGIYGMVLYLLPSVQFPAAFRLDQILLFDMGCLEIRSMRIDRSSIRAKFSRGF